MKYWKYFWTLVKHKWLVFVECFKDGMYWQGITHDLSKFFPDEFFPYADKFGKDVSGRRTTEEEDVRFERAAMIHKRRNRHHWEYWVTLSMHKDLGVRIHVFNIPKKYRLEMLNDWRGASKSYVNGEDVLIWYAKNSPNMILHASTRIFIERDLGIDDLLKCGGR